MSTIKQIEANRLNAKKSTGPRSAEGKAASSMNALKSGIDAQSHIIRGEDQALLDALTTEYLERFRPAAPEERFYVATLIRDDWQLRRLSKADAQIWEYEMDSAFSLNKDSPLGHAFSRGDRVFIRLQRRIDTAERSYQRALRELERLQAIRPSAAPEPLPPLQPIEDVPFSPAIGFVPQPSPPAPIPSDPDPPPIAPASRSPLLPPTTLLPHLIGARSKPAPHAILSSFQYGSRELLCRSSRPIKVRLNGSRKPARAKSFAVMLLAAIS
jgi:hypothetical protein